MSVKYNNHALLLEINREQKWIICGKFCFHLYVFNTSNFFFSQFPTSRFFLVSGHFTLLFIMTCGLFSYNSLFLYTFSQSMACSEHSAISEGITSISNIFHIYFLCVTSTFSCYFITGLCNILCVLAFCCRRQALAMLLVMHGLDSSSQFSWLSIPYSWDHRYILLKTCVI